jgi:hypothetical protein
MLKQAKPKSVLAQRRKGAKKIKGIIWARYRALRPFVFSREAES